MERVAIPWLHVLREHPIFLMQYEGLFEPRSLAGRFFDYWFRTAVQLALWCRLGWRVVRSSGKLWHGNLPKTGSFDVVFVSHLLKVSHLVAEDDFYFGTTPVDLARKGKSVLIVLINHTSAIGDELERSLGQSPIPRVVISSGLAPKDEFRIWRRLKVEANRLRHESNKECVVLRKAILRRAAMEATANNSKTSLRIARVISEVVLRCQAKTLVTTYEGHAWERVTYASVREAKPDVVCIAYLHAALFRLQHAAQRSLGEKYDPDFILTAGPVGLKQFQNSGSLRRIPSAILGSNRSISKVNPNRGAACLVLPEGLAEECKILFAFSLLCAEACPQIEFIWRLHPILTFKNLVRQFPILKTRPSNVKISTRTFEDDIARSTWALYRGSTAAITAVANGVMPIHLRQPGELTTDPLYEISSGHPSVENVQQFTIALGSTNRDSTSVEYCRTYYSPLDSDALAKLCQHV